MSLFKRKKPLSADMGKVWDLEPELVNYDSVLEYLVGLSEVDFDKITKVANIYRKADFDAAQELEVANEPTTFITPPEPPSDALEPNFLDDISSDSHDTTASRKQRETAQKATNVAKKIKVNQ